MMRRPRMIRLLAIAVALACLVGLGQLRGGPTFAAQGSCTPGISSANLNSPGYVGHPSNFVFALYPCYKSPTWSYSSGTNAPPGIALGSTGVFSGNFTTAGTFTFSMTLDYANITKTTTASYTITVYGTSSVSPTGLTATGSSTATVTPQWTVTANQNGTITGFQQGTVPSNIVLSLPQGTPSATLTATIPAGVGGAWYLVVTMSNGAGTSTQNVTLTVNVAPSSFTSTPPLTGQVGVAYGPFTFAASGYPAPTVSVPANTLPPGLNLVNGVLSGNPTVSGAFSFTVTAMNSSGSTPTNLTITIAPAGVRTAYVASTELSPVGTSGGVQTSTGSLTLWAMDTTNTNAGWNVTVQSGPFVYSGPNGGSTIPAADFGITSLGALTKSSGQAISTGTDAAPTGPQSANLSSGVSGALNVARKVLTAAPGYGTGSYSQLVNVALGVPASSKPGLYTGSLTITIASGP